MKQVRKELIPPPQERFSTSRSLGSQEKCQQHQMAIRVDELKVVCILSISCGH